MEISEENAVIESIEYDETKGEESITIVEDVMLDEDGYELKGEDGITYVEHVTLEEEACEETKGEESATIETIEEEDEPPFKKRWSDQDIQRLIALYRENEHLWDMQNKYYGRKLKKRETLQRIANIFKLTPHDIAKKLHCLRNQFNYEIKKMKQRAEEGLGEIRSTWTHFTSLLFLRHPEIIDQYLEQTMIDFDQPIEDQEVIHNEEVKTQNDVLRSRDRVKWTHPLTCSLIKLYKENECLWNRHRKDYRNRVKRNFIIAQIAERIQVRSDDVTRKLHILRSQFSLELRKCHKRSTSFGRTYKSKWHYFSKLKFLMDESTNYNAEKEENDNCAEDMDHCYSEVNEKPSDVSEVANTSSSLSHTPKIHSRVPTKIKCEPSFDMSPYVMLHQPKGQEEAFGEFVASELRQIENQSNKRILKKIIMEAIAKIAEADALGNVYEEHLAST